MIERYETVTINTLSFTKSAFGEQGVTKTVWFSTRAKIHDINTAIKIQDKFRGYGDITQMTVNYSPNMRLMVGAPGNYSITLDGVDWRIEDSKTDNMRQFVTFICYHNDPTTAV